MLKKNDLQSRAIWAFDNALSRHSLIDLSIFQVISGNLSPKKRNYKVRGKPLKIFRSKINTY